MKGFFVMFPGRGGPEHILDKCLMCLKALSQS